MQRPGNSLQGHHNLAPACLPTSPCSFLRMGHCTSTTLAMLGPASGPLHQPCPWLACSGHICARLVLFIIKASARISLSQKVIPNHCICPSPVPCFSHSLSLYPVWSSSGQVPLFQIIHCDYFMGAGALHILLIAVPPAHDSTWDTCTWDTHIFNSRLLHKVSFKQRTLLQKNFRLWGMGMKVKESLSFICTI